MTGRRRLRAALATLTAVLVMVGLWAIPVASADTTATTSTGAASGLQCVSVSYDDGTTQPVQIPVGDPVTVAELIVLANAGSHAARPERARDQHPKRASRLLDEFQQLDDDDLDLDHHSRVDRDDDHDNDTTTTPAPTTSTPTTSTEHHHAYEHDADRRPGPARRTSSRRARRPTRAPSSPIARPSTTTRPSGSKHKKSKRKHRATPAKHKTTKPKSAGAGSSGATTPATSLTLPPAPPVGVPNLFLDSFQIPPFLLPIYQAAGIQYQVPWQVLAAINEIETDYGRNLSVSSAGAVGWMQFMPTTWKEWGIDANGDGVADPFNPVDAIFSAARYLQAAGAATNLSKAVFAYNHADWYVNQVLLRAKLIGAMPQSVIGALTGLVEGHFPVAAAAHYSDGSIVALTKHRVTGSNAAVTVDSNPDVTGSSIYAKPGSPVVAVNDGKIVKLGDSATLGRYIELQDATGNVYTYSELGSVSSTYPVPKPVTINSSNAASQLGTASANAPTTAASVGSQPTVFTDAVKGTQARLALTAQSRSALTADAGDAASTTSAVPAPKSAASAGGQSDAQGGSQTSSETATQTSTVSAPLAKERLFAHPARPASYAAGGIQQLHNVSNALSSFKNYFADTLHLAKNQYTLQPLRVGSIVIAGTVLGRVAAPSQSAASHLYFQIQPAGHAAPDIDPKPILDGWKLLQATNVYGANGVNPFYGPGAKNPTVGQVLLMSKQQLERRVLVDPHVQIYACGRRDIEAGKIDRRVLAVIEYLSTSGLHPDVTGLACDASVNGTTGVDEAGSTGESVDISAINGVPIAGPHRRRVGHRPDDPQAAGAAGIDGADADHRPDLLPRPVDDIGAAEPRQPDPDPVRILLRKQREGLQAGRVDPQAGPVDQADQPALRDSRAGRSGQPEPVRDPRARALIRRSR